MARITVIFAVNCPSNHAAEHELRRAGLQFNTWSRVSIMDAALPALMRLLSSRPSRGARS